MAPASQPIRSASIPSFPPPPMSATLMKEQSKRKPKSKRQKTTSPKPPQVSPLRRSRLFLLPTILVVTFTVLILGVIYSYCVASKHTSLTDAQLASPSDVEINGSIFYRREFVPNDLPSLGPVPTGIVGKRSPLPDTAATTSIAGVTANGANNTSEGDRTRPSNKSSMSAGLIFYTLTAPLFTILLVSAELLLAMPFASTSENTSISSPIEDVKPRSRFSGKLTSRRAHLILLILTIVNICSLSITSSFWTRCELPPPSITRDLTICPLEIRGHWMGGIHEVSIAKVSLSWLVVIGLVCHAFFIFSNMKTERRRWALSEGHGKAEEVDFTIKEEDVEAGPRNFSRVRFQ